MSLQQGKNQMSTSLSPFGTMPSTCQHLVRFLLRQLWQQDTHTHMHPYMHIHTGKLLFNSVIVSFRLHKPTRNKSPPNLSSVCGAFQTFYNLCLRQSPGHYCFCWDLSPLISPLPQREDILCHVATILNMLIPCLDKVHLILAIVCT